MNIIEAEACGNDIVLEMNRPVLPRNLMPLNEELAERDEVEKKELMQGKVIEEVLFL